MELSLLILVCIHKSYIVYLEIYVVPIGKDVKLEFFSKSKLESKKSIKTGNSFPVRTGRVVVAEHPVAWWLDCDGPRAMAVSRRCQRRASDM